MRAVAQFEEAIKQDPTYAPAYSGLSDTYRVYLLTLRRHEEAVRALRRAAELSPLSPVINTELGLALKRAPL